MTEEAKPRRIFMKSGEPFASRRAASVQMGLHRKKGTETKIVEVEGGFVLEEITPDELAKRPARVPLNVRNVLTAPNRPGFKRRFVNDVGDRIEMFLNGGWSIVTDEDLQIGDSRAGKATRLGTPHTKNVGQGVTAVLMEIPQDEYDRRQAVKQAEITYQENALRLQAEGEGAYGKVDIGARGRL